MKVKNRRSTNRPGSDPDRSGGPAGVPYDYHSPKRRRNAEANSRSGKMRKSPNRTVPNGSSDARADNKKRKPPNSMEHSTGPLSPKNAPSNPSHSCSSSASSVVSSSGDPADPYEFAVKADEEPGEYPSNAAHPTNSVSGPPPMKMMKLDRMEDRCMPDSARSSPLTHTQHNQLSPDSRSSPLAIHCTRPLSVLTDFSTASANSFPRATLAEVDSTFSSQPKSHPSTTTSYTAHTLDTLIARPSAGALCSNRPSSPPTLQHQQVPDGAGGKTPTTTAGVMDATLLQPQRHQCSPRGTARPCPILDSSPTTSPVPLPSTLIVGNPSVSPTPKRCVGVNTTLDTSKSTVTEPDLLGPCEPGTTICLNGIVWLETTTGVLVVNVTWRGRTYIGTLLDATQHDFAPPCPRDYVPAFKSNAVRSSNRNKRRTGLTNSYRHHNSTGVVACGTSDSNGKSIPSTTAAQRNRLRGRTGNSPTAGAVASSNQSSRTQQPTDSTESEGAKTRFEASGNETDAHVNALASDEEAVLDTKAPNSSNSKHGSCSSSSECPSDCLPDGDKNDHRSANLLENARLSTIPSTQSDHPGATPTTDGSKVTVAERATTCEDEELRNSFPIICPIEGCQKRFTNMTALRFHLNHTRHESSTASSQTRAKPASGQDIQCTSSTQPFKVNRGSASSPPPTIFPSGSRSPLPTIPSSRPRSAECTDRNKSDEFPIPANKDIADLASSSRVHSSSTANNPIACPLSSMTTLESQRPCSKGLPSTAVANAAGLVSNDSPGATQLTTRTVTAHTVSIPCGLAGLSDGSAESNGSRTNNQSTNRQRCSSGHRSDTHNRSRGHSATKSSTHPHKTAEPRRSTDLTTMDYYNASPFLARSTSSTGPATFAGSRSETGPADFANFPTISQGTLGLPVPSTNQLFPLVWNFPNSSTGAENSARPGGVYGDGGVSTLPDGTHATSLFASPLARSSVCGLPQPTISLPTGQGSISSSGYNPIAEPNHSSVPSSSQPAPLNRPGPHNLIDPASFYGLPEFLVVAAMNALNANGAGAAVDNTPQSPYTLPTGGNPGLPPPRPVQFSQNADLAPAQSIKPPTHSIVHTMPPHMPTMGSVFPGTMVHTSLAPGGLPSLAPSSSLPGAIPPVSSDRFDPFKLSAAYLMQQAVAGSQLSSIFGQP